MNRYQREPKDPFAGEPCETCPDEQKRGCYHKNCPTYLAWQKKNPDRGPGYGFYRGY